MIFKVTDNQYCRLF